MQKSFTEQKPEFSYGLLKKIIADFKAGSITNLEFLEALGIKEADLVNSYSSLNAFLETYSNDKGVNEQDILINLVLKRLGKEELEPILKPKPNVTLGELKAKAAAAEVAQNYCEGFFIQKAMIELLETKLKESKKKELSIQNL
jgi:hypothetical protein